MPHQIPASFMQILETPASANMKHRTSRARAELWPSSGRAIERSGLSEGSAGLEASPDAVPNRHGAATKASTRYGRPEAEKGVVR